MQYNQPYGVSDPNAAYINGNPSTGQMGSIPPAASIEYPQREIVNVILAAELATPSNSDLQQLAKAIQSGQLNFEHDTGTANNYACNMSPDPGGYFEGLWVILKILNTNTGPSVLNLNSHGNQPTARQDGSPNVANDLVAGTYVCFLYDGSVFRSVWSTGSATIAGMPVWLTGPRQLYVNGGTGNDSWDGTSATFVSGTKGPFKTLQRAANEYPKYNLNGYSVQINAANGTYAKVNCPPGNGSGTISWVGNVATPENVVVSSMGVGGTAITVSGAGPSHVFSGFYCTTNAALPGDPGFGIWAAQGSDVSLEAMAFGPNANACIGCSEAILGIDGPIHQEGNSQIFLDCDGGRIIKNAVNYPQLLINTTSVMSVCWEYANNVGRIVGPWGSIGGAANAVGQQYQIYGNGILNTYGTGVAHIPGSTAGTVASGGQAF